MSEKRRGLGRGLGALIPNINNEINKEKNHNTERPIDVFFTKNPPSEKLVSVPGAIFTQLDPKTITPNPRQPRTIFNETDMNELVHSIKEIGILQPIIVRPIKKPTTNIKYEIIMGERRWRASKIAKITHIPAIIKETSDNNLLRDALLENLHRSQLNPLEEAAAYKQLIEDFESTHDELAERIGRSRPQISNTLRLLKLPPKVQKEIAFGNLSAGHGRTILALENETAIEKLAQRIIKENLSVRATEKIVNTNKTKNPKNIRAGKNQKNLDIIATRLENYFGSGVKINLGTKKGKISIDFHSVKELNRILALMNTPDKFSE